LCSIPQHQAPKPAKGRVRQSPIIGIAVTMGVPRAKPLPYFPIPNLRSRAGNPTINRVDKYSAIEAPDGRIGTRTLPKEKTVRSLTQSTRFRAVWSLSTLMRRGSPIRLQGATAPLNSKARAASPRRSCLSITTRKRSLRRCPRVHLIVLLITIWELRRVVVRRPVRTIIRLSQRVWGHPTRLNRQN